MVFMSAGAKPCHPFLLSCEERLAFALKWSCPGMRFNTFPREVSLRRFVAALFVFAMVFNNKRYAAGAGAYVARSRIRHGNKV